MYYITSKCNSEIGFWEAAQAKTLAGAKREATKRYGKGYRDSTLHIAIGDNVTEPLQIIASKGITERRWQGVR